MIEAIYHRNVYRLTVKGHAGAAEKGEDLICAGASTLVMTLAANIINMNGVLRKPVTLKLEEGDAEIYCVPKNSMKNTMKLVFDSVCVGFDVMAQRYPEYIHYEVRE